MKIHNSMEQAESLFKQTSALGSSIGSSSAIATSKMIKITTIRKNQDENSSHAEDFGSNPHSNGDFFLDLLYFPLRLKLLGITAVDSRIVIVSIVVTYYYYYYYYYCCCFRKFLDLKSSVLVLY